MKPMLDSLEYGVDRCCATITINRPDRRNALDEAAYGEIQAALDTANRDPEVGAIVLTGAGEQAFASGADLKTVNRLEPEEYRRYLTVNAATRLKMYGLDKPVVARVNGAALGGAMSLACSCDIIVAVDTAVFGQTEINVGLVGGVDHLWTLGRALTAELMMTGRVLSAAEALQLGLVNKVVPRDQLDGTVRSLVDSLLSKPPHALSLTKRILAFSTQVSGFAAARSFQAEMVLSAFDSDDRREGMSAFLEKRKPDFSRFPRFP